jgi:protein-S-isoprenylcysteine O-methyltransferase Ste14
MDWLRIYLLAGLLLHKVVWEYMKRRGGSDAAAPAKRQPLSVKLIKAVKIAILLGIIDQTLLPDILPITADPMPLRIAGAILFTAGLATALAARIHLGRNWLDIETAAVKSRQQVVDRGIYGYIRHPIYTADLILLLGLELALNSWLVYGVVLLAAVVLLQAIREERMLSASLPGYESYCRRTKRFIPFVA